MCLDRSARTREFARRADRLLAFEHRIVESLTMQKYRVDRMNIAQAYDAFPPMENHRDVYLASEVDARIAALEKALRTVSIIDLGFGVPKYFCAGCASYGDGPESIQHKDDCIVARTLSLMESVTK